MPITYVQAVADDCGSPGRRGFPEDEHGSFAFESRFGFVSHL